MSQAPCISVPLPAHVHEGLALLVSRSTDGLTKKDKAMGIDLLTDAYCHVIDHILVSLLDEISNRYESRQITEARRMAEQVKQKARHYIPWAGGFISAKRLPPVIAYFNSLVYQIDDDHHITVPISASVAERSNAIIASLQTGKAEDLTEGVALLSQVIDHLIGPLVIEPKNLLRFNFVVNKTLDGVIGLLHSLITRSLGKFGRKVSSDLYPLIGSHLGRFLVID